MVQSPAQVWARLQKLVSGRKGTGLLISTPGLANWVGFYLMTTIFVDHSSRQFLYILRAEEGGSVERGSHLVSPVEAFVTKIEIFAQ